VVQSVFAGRCQSSGLYGEEFSRRIHRKVELLGPGSPRASREDRGAPKPSHQRQKPAKPDMDLVPEVSHSPDKLKHITLGELLGLPTGGDDIDGGNANTEDLWHVLPAVVPAYHHILTAPSFQPSPVFPGSVGNCVMKPLDWSGDVCATVQMSVLVHHDLN
jgi:hypothetical protein